MQMEYIALTVYLTSGKEKQTLEDNTVNKKTTHLNSNVAIRVKLWF